MSEPVNPQIDEASSVHNEYKRLFGCLFSPISVAIDEDLEETPEEAQHVASPIEESNSCGSSAVSVPENGDSLGNPDQRVRQAKSTETVGNVADSTSGSNEVDKPSPDILKAREGGLPAIEHRSPAEVQQVANPVAGSNSHASGAVSTHENVAQPSNPSQVVQLATPSETAALTFPLGGYVGVAAKFAEL
jgi:hypothetical protein